MFKKLYILLTFSIILQAVCSIAADDQRRILALSKRKIPDSGEYEEHKASQRHTKKLSPTSPKIKYQPFQLPQNYNKLQIPNLAYVLAIKNPMASDEFETWRNQRGNLNHEVNATVRVQGVSDVNEISGDITFSMDLVLEWVDETIAAEGKDRFNTSTEGFDPRTTDHLFKTLDHEFLNEIWKPDIFIEGLVKVTHPELMTKPVTVRLNEVTGEVIYVSRLRVQMECEMDLHYYPCDTQTCRVDLRSHSYSNDELTLRWAQPVGVVLEACGGSNYDFQLTDVGDDVHEEGYTANTTREFSGLRFSLLARRKLSYHMVQTFVPSIFFIVITWLCFLVPSTMVEARVGITMTTLLALTAMFGAIRESSPTTSYVRAIDIWMLACIFFVFLTFLEFTILVCLRDSKSKEKTGPVNECEKMRKTESIAIDIENSKDVVKDPKTKENENGGATEPRVGRNILVSEFIEKYAFIIFSTAFVTFDFLFWFWLLKGSDYYAWRVDPKYNLCLTSWPIKTIRRSG